MDDKIDKALEILLDQVRTNLKPPEALQQTQALLNMAHAKQILLTIPLTVAFHSEQMHQVQAEAKSAPKKQGTT